MIEIQTENLTTDSLPMTDAKMSDWIEQQPLSRFCSGLPRNNMGKMCGLGMMADFLGIDWSGPSTHRPKVKTIRWDTDGVFSFIESALDAKGQRVPHSFNFGVFDRFMSYCDPQGAKNYLLKCLREAGL